MIEEVTPEEEIETQKCIRLMIISQARYMAFDDAKKMEWNEEAIASAALAYSTVEVWYLPFINPTQEQREEFCIAYITCFREQVALRKRKKAGYVFRVKDIGSQLVACGGYIYTRKELYKDLIKEGNSHECADSLSFGTPEYRRGDW